MITIVMIEFSKPKIKAISSSVVFNLSIKPKLTKITLGIEALKNAFGLSESLRTSRQSPFNCKFTSTSLFNSSVKLSLLSL